jgi:formylglycine-generating enzyme required for sulfatase activity
MAVPGGTYLRGYDLAGDGESGDMTAPATISGFQLDKYEVTVGRYRTFVATGDGTIDHPPASNAGAHPQIANSGWDPGWDVFLPLDRDAQMAALKCNSGLQKLSTWTDSPGANETRPITCLSWYDAMAFCAWDGGYVPTDAEWNFAAAGGEAQRAYPWSSPPGDIASLDPSHASYADDNNCVGDSQPGCGPTDLVPVGTDSAGDGRWGHSDLAGNAYEWTLDFAQQAYPSPCTDCADLSDTSRRNVRGGSAVTLAIGLRTGVRIPGIPEKRDSVTGVRCARPR